MEEIRSLFKKHRTLVAVVTADHDQKNALGDGHNFYHAAEVANLGFQLCTNKGMAELVWLGGILHNSDHLFGKSRVLDNLMGYLSLTNLPKKSKALVIEAVVNHNAHKKDYRAKDSPVKKSLMDADKLACLGATVIFRAAQFMKGLPDYDPRFVTEKDPRANYRAPGTLVRDIQGVLEWINEPGWFRYKEAEEIAWQRGQFLQQFLETLKFQLGEAYMLTPDFPAELCTDAPAKK